MVQWKVFIDSESVKDSRDKDIEAKLKPELQNIIRDTFAYFECMADVKVDWEEHFTVGSSESEVLFEDCLKQVEKFGVMPGEMEPTRFVRNVDLVNRLHEKDGQPEDTMYLSIIPSRILTGLNGRYNEANGVASPKVSPFGDSLSAYELQNNAAGAIITFNPMRFPSGKMILAYLREAVFRTIEHEVGHVYGAAKDISGHCPEEACTMHAEKEYGVEKTFDSDFCPDCTELLKDNLRKIHTA